MNAPQPIRQPGPVQRERVLAVAAKGRALRLALPAGERLLDAVARGFAQEGFASGVAELGALALSPFSYVMPALSATPDHAAFYSAKHTPAGVTRLHEGALTFGRREGAPFFHAHALWREADGKECGGHLLPEATFLAEDAEIDAFGLDGARFEAQFDPETNFTLFEPVASSATGAGTIDCLALRLRPNIPFLPTLERVARQAGFARCAARGGVGSLVGARFHDGRRMKRFPTEVYLRRKHGEHPSEVGLVDDSGACASGALEPEANITLMTFELVLVDERTQLRGKPAGSIST